MQFHFARWRVPVAAFVAAFALAGAAQAQLRAPKPAATPALPREPGPTTIDADYIEGIGGQETTARGNAELRQDDTVIFGDFLRYNQEFGRIEADGGVRLQQGNDRFSGPRLRYDSRNHTGVFEEPSFLLRGDQPARGKAEQNRIPRPRAFQDEERHLHILRAGARRLALRYGRARHRLRHPDRHAAQRNAQVFRCVDRADPLDLLPAREPAQERVSLAHLHAIDARRPRAVAAVLLEHRPGAGCDDHAALHFPPRLDAAERVPLYRPPLRGRDALRGAARRQTGATHAHRLLADAQADVQPGADGLPQSEQGFRRPILRRPVLAREPDLDRQPAARGIPAVQRKRQRRRVLPAKPDTALPDAAGPAQPGGQPVPARAAIVVRHLEERYRRYR